MKRQILFILFTIGMVTSCTPTTTLRKEPLAPGDTLVIGRVLFHNTMTKTGRVKIGKYKYGIELIVEDVETKQLKQIETVDVQGFFYFYNPDFNRFCLKQIRYSTYDRQPEIHHKKKKPSAKYSNKETIASFTAKSNICYEIVPNTVNNIGQIYWTGDTQHNKHSIKFNLDYQETKNEFTQRYPKSLWNKEKWVTVEAQKTYRPSKSFDVLVIEGVTGGLIEKAADNLSEKIKKESK